MKSGGNFYRYKSIGAGGSNSLAEYNKELRALHVALFAAKHVSGGFSSIVTEPVCLVVEPAKAKSSAGSATTTTTTSTGAALATAMPAVGAVAVAGLSVYVGML